MITTVVLLSSDCGATMARKNSLQEETSGGTRLSGAFPPQGRGTSSCSWPRSVVFFFFIQRSCWSYVIHLHIHHLQQTHDRKVSDILTFSLRIWRRILVLLRWMCPTSGPCSWHLVFWSFWSVPPLRAVLQLEGEDKTLTVNNVLAYLKISLLFQTSVQDVTAMSSYLSLVEQDVSRLPPLLTNGRAGAFRDRWVIIGEPAVGRLVRTVIRMNAVTDVVS